MVEELKDRYNALSLSNAEVNALKELEALLWESGALQKGEAIPVQTSFSA